jgi:hypothetical protein
VKIFLGDSVVWQGRVGERAEWINISVKQMILGGPLPLEIVSDAPPVRENNNADARSLGFAVYGVALE